MKNFLIAVCTYKKNLNRAFYLKKIFKHYSFDNYFFYYGEKDDAQDKCVSLDTSDCYSELTNKTYKMFNYAINKDFDYLIKIDDDTFVDIEKLKNLNLEGCDYIGGVSSLKNHLENFNFYKNYLLKKSLKKNINFDYTEKLENFKYVMGNFCIFSKELILKILKFNDNIYKEIPQEDISVGYVCSKIGAKILDIKEELPFYHITKQGLSYHPVPQILQKLFINKSEAERKSLCNKYISLNKYFLK